MNRLPERGASFVDRRRECHGVIRIRRHRFWHFNCNALALILDRGVSEIHAILSVSPDCLSARPFKLTVKNVEALHHSRR